MANSGENEHPRDPTLAHLVYQFFRFGLYFSVTSIVLIADSIKHCEEMSIVNNI